MPSLGGDRKFLFDEIKKNFDLSELIVWGSVSPASPTFMRMTGPLTANRII